MEAPLLGDKNLFPSDEVLAGALGKTKAVWDGLFHSLEASRPELSCEWRYYNDGKSWLMKVVRKKATVFWVAVAKGYFIVTFYFGDKAEALIMESDVGEEYKKAFVEGKRIGKLHPVTVELRKKKDVAAVEELVVVKLKLK